MSTNTDLYGVNMHANGFIAIPLEGLDIAIYDALNPTCFPHYYVYDVDEVTVIGGMTINEYLIVNTNRKVKYTTDGIYCYWGLMIPLSSKGQEAVLNIMGTGDLTFGEDFTNGETNKYFLMNEFELKEWLSVTPHMI